MKAALLSAPGLFKVEEVPRSKCTDGGLLIKVEACSICASDIKMFRSGHRDLAYPRILGHEVVGTIIESRSGRKGLECGTRVQVWPGVPCGTCIQCLKGNDNQCPSIRILGFNHDGGFAEHTSVPVGCVRSGGAVPVPDSLPSDVASLTEPLACCVNAQEALRVGEGDNVMVIGAGPLGALHIMLAKERGVASTFVVEKDSSRCSMISKARPSKVINAAGNDARESVMEFTEGKGADVIILATPETVLDDQLIDLLAPRGRLCLFSGLPERSAKALTDLNKLHYLERTVIGSYGCRSCDNRAALRLLSEAKVDASWLITKRVPLEGIDEGLRHAADREGMKATVTDF